MPKIKNWSRSESRLSKQWKHDEAPIYVDVQEIGDRGEWVVDVTRPRTDNLVAKEVPSKEKAMKIARKWMKNHPNG